jgi:hypothetical protein
VGLGCEEVDTLYNLEQVLKMTVVVDQEAEEGSSAASRDFLVGYNHQWHQ